MRRVLLSGLIGSSPGLLMIAVSIGVELWVETGGGLGFGILGMLLLWLGMFLGMLNAASHVDYGGRLMLGVGVGFAVGLVLGMAIDATLITSGVPAGGALWVLFVPVGMLTGALAVTWYVEHGGRRLTPSG